MIDISDAMEQRAERVTSGDPGLVVRYAVYTNGLREWGLVTILTEDRRIVGLEFFESEESWKRPSALDDYARGVSEGYPVSVVVPDNVFDNVVDTVHTNRGGGYNVYNYAYFNIKPKVLA